MTVEADLQDLKLLALAALVTADAQGEGVIGCRLAEAIDAIDQRLADVALAKL